MQSYFSKKTVWAGIALCFFMVTSSISYAGSADDFKKGLFTRIQHLPCGKTDVVITTSCIYRNNGDDVYCFNQNISFLKRNGDILRNANYNAPFLDENQPFVAGLSCIPAKGKFYLLAESANFGNCDGCEWNDLFTEEGIYLGSNALERNASNNFKHRMAPAKFYDPVAEERYSEKREFYDQKMLSIIRMPLSEEQKK